MSYEDLTGRAQAICFSWLLVRASHPYQMTQSYRVAKGHEETQEKRKEYQHLFVYELTNSIHE